MSMISLTFNRAGDVSVYASQDGVTINVTAPINQLQAVLPSATFAAVRDRVAAFLDATSQAPAIAGGGR